MSYRGLVTGSLCIALGLSPIAVKSCGTTDHYNIQGEVMGIGTYAFSNELGGAVWGYEVETEDGDTIRVPHRLMPPDLEAGDTISATVQDRGGIPWANAAEELD